MLKYTMDTNTKAKEKHKIKDHINMGTIKRQFDVARRTKNYNLNF